MSDFGSAARQVNAAREQLENAERSLLSALSGRGRKRGIAVCGTPSGYQKHRLIDEPACYACKVAHRWAAARREGRTL